MNENPINTETQAETFKEYALLELFGHNRIAGLCTVETVGAPMIRVDVPDAADNTLFTKFYSPAAIYAITPVTKQIAIGLAIKLNVQPVTRFDITRLAEGQVQLPLGTCEDLDDRY